MKKMILEIIDDHSGGIKFTELICDVTEYLCKEKKSISPDLSDILEQVISEMSELKILDYGMIMGDTIRHKMFVYRPLDNGINLFVKEVNKALNKEKK